MPYDSCIHGFSFCFPLLVLVLLVCVSISRPGLIGDPNDITSDETFSIAIRGLAEVTDLFLSVGNSSVAKTRSIFKASALSPPGSSLDPASSSQPRRATATGVLREECEELSLTGSTSSPSVKRHRSVAPGYVESTTAGGSSPSLPVEQPHSPEAQTLLDLFGDILLRAGRRVGERAIAGRTAALTALCRIFCAKTSQAVADHFVADFCSLLEDVCSLHPVGIAPW